MENKFLWLCAFIDVLGTLYVGIYEIGSFPSIFLHSYFLRSWCFQPLANLFHWIWTICKICDAETVCVCHKVMEHSANPRTHCDPRAQGLTRQWAAPALPHRPAVTGAAQPRSSASASTFRTTEVRVQMHSTWKFLLYLKSNPNKARLLLWNSFFFSNSLMC